MAATPIVAGSQTKVMHSVLELRQREALHGSRLDRQHVQVWPALRGVSLPGNYTRPQHSFIASLYILVFFRRALFFSKSLFCFARNGVIPV